MNYPRAGRDTVEVKKRRLRTELRYARLNRQMTQKEVADKLDWSVSKLIRMEQGTVPVTLADVRVLLQLYNITDESRTNELVDLAKEARKDKGWSTFRDVLSLESLELFGNEEAASVILKFEPTVIPDLLQTEEYARSLMQALGVPEEQINRRLDVRARRQRLLVSPRRPELTLILGEIALSRPIGSEDTMRVQIAHVLETANTQRISVLLLPFAAGAHRGMDSAFTVLQFNDRILPDLLYRRDGERENISSDDAERESISRYEEVEKITRRYLDLFAELKDMASRYGSLEENCERILYERYNKGV